MIGIEVTVICEGCLLAIDLRRDHPDLLVGWSVVNIREGATFADVDVHDLAFRCPECARG